MPCHQRPVRALASARAYHRVLKIARTIADLDGGGDITTAHVTEATSPAFASAAMVRWPRLSCSPHRSPRSGWILPGMVGESGAAYPLGPPAAFGGSVPFRHGV